MMQSFRYTYGCTCGNGRGDTYGRRFYVFNRQNYNDDLHNSHSSQSGSISHDSTNSSDAANIQRDLSGQFYAQKIRDQDEIIASLKAALLENKTNEDEVTGMGAACTKTMFAQMQRLQEDKEQLMAKLSQSHACESQLKQENQRLLKHMEEMVGLEDSTIEQSDSSCSTDTEKELDKFKRQYLFLSHEIQVLRQENFNLHQSTLNKRFGNDENGNTLDHTKYNSRERNEEIMTLSSGNKDKLGVTFLEDEKQFFEQKINKLNIINEGKKENSVDEQWKLEQQAYRLKLEKANTTVSKLHTGITDLQEECDDLYESYKILKSENESVSTRMKMIMRDTVQEIQLTLASLTQQNEKLMQKYKREMKLRKKLQNQLVELKGNIRVFCRIRPCIKEDDQDDDSGIGMRMVVSPDLADDGFVNVDNKGRSMDFDMDKVFGTQCCQEEVFEEVAPLVRSALDGYNVCIFAYGQTGSGKTYTMEGPPENPGINQRALQLLFEDHSQGGWTYEICASVLEIYNEAIRDLLNPDPSNKLEVKLKQEGGLHVPGLVVVPVSNLQEVNMVFETGRCHRAKAATNMNDLSSRSHCLLCVTINGHNRDTGISTTGRLNLVDLAGSERLSRSHADGDRLKEAQNINRSLACLGDVIHALRCKQGHIPYRNSKLTYLLQDSLGGDSKTLMIVQVSPIDKNVSETVCTLNFGQRVRSVEMGVASKNISSSKTPTQNGRQSVHSNGSQSPSLLALPSSPSPVPSGSGSSSPLSPMSPTPLSPRFTKSHSLGSSSPCSSPNPSTKTFSRQNSVRVPSSTKKSLLSRSMSFNQKSSKSSSTRSQQDFLSSYPPPSENSTVDPKRTNKKTPSSSENRSLTPTSSIVNQRTYLSSKATSQNQATTKMLTQQKLAQNKSGLAPIPQKSNSSSNSMHGNKAQTRPASSIDWL